MKVQLMLHLHFYNISAKMVLETKLPFRVNRKPCSSNSINPWVTKGLAFSIISLGNGMPKPLFTKSVLQSFG